MTVKITGLKEVREKIKRMENPHVFFDDVVSDSAEWMWREFADRTPFDTDERIPPHTRNMWESPDKLDYSLYQIDNTKTSADGKHAIAAILNYGRKEVRPVNAKMLFIPKSKRAQYKAPGAKIPKGWKRGTKQNYKDPDVDYFMTDYAKAYPGTGFIQDVEKEGQNLLVKEIIAKVRRTFK